MTYISVPRIVASTTLVPLRAVHLEPLFRLGVRSLTRGRDTGSRRSRSGGTQPVSTSSPGPKLCPLHRGQDVGFPVFAPYVFMSQQQTAQTLPLHSRQKTSWSLSQIHSKQTGHLIGTKEGVDVSSFEPRADISGLVILVHCPKRYFGK